MLNDWSVVEIWDQIWFETVQNEKSFPHSVHDVLVEFGFDDEQARRLSRVMIMPKAYGRLAKCPNVDDQMIIQKMVNACWESV